MRYRAIPFLSLDYKGERDVTLRDGDPFWLTVGQVSIWISPHTDGSVNIQCFRAGAETEEPIAGCTAILSEYEED